MTAEFGNAAQVDHPPAPHERSTLLGQRKQDAIKAYRSGRVTLRDFARALGLDTWAAHDLLRAEGVETSQGDRAETTPALDAVTGVALATETQALTAR